jgi:hypothetical protein
VSHRPQTCDHVYSNWDYEPERVEAGILVRNLIRTCYLCHHVDQYGREREAPADNDHNRNQS